MRGNVTYLVRDGVAIVELDNGRANLATPSVRKSLSASLARAVADDAVAGIVLRARGPDFGMGSDAELVDASHAAAPSPHALTTQIETSPKPVIAAIQGTSGGLATDLALACHERVAQRDARISCADLKLGLIPAGGAALRLPRLVGAAMALEMLLKGRVLGAEAAREAGLVDAIVEDKAGSAAFVRAGELARESRPPKPVSSRMHWAGQPEIWLSTVRAARARLPEAALPAAREIVSIVEAAILLPVDEARAFDAAAYAMLARSEEARALSRLARSEARAAMAPQRLGAQARPVRRVAILGDRARGHAMATRCLDAGLEVIFATEGEAALEDAYVRIGEALDAKLAAGELAEEAVEARFEKLRMVCGVQAMSQADVILDMRSDDAAAAAALASRVDAVARAGAVLAHARAGVTVSAVARATSRPQDVLGLRLGEPETGGVGAEIIAPSAQSRHAMATLFTLMRRLGRLPVLSFDEGEGIIASLGTAMMSAADAVLEMGAAHRHVAAALEDWGQVRALFEARHAGTDHAARPATLGATALAVESGDPGHPALTPKAIRRICLAAAVNEGARLLSDGVARSPGDIDVLGVHALGMRRRSGGPMCAGDLAGLLSLRRALPRRDAREGAGVAPHPLLDDLIKNGRDFQSLEPSRS